MYMYIHVTHIHLQDCQHIKLLYVYTYQIMVQIELLKQLSGTSEFSPHALDTESRD